MPALLVLAATVVYPIVWSAISSLRAFDLRSPHLWGTFVGAQNYARVVSEPDFRRALAQTAGFVAVTLAVELTIGFAVALMLHKGVPGHRAFRIAFALPLMVAPVVAGLQWRWLLADQYGAVNHALSLLGVRGPLWLATPWGARVAVLMANVWLATPFVVLVLLAALANLPEEPFEAARIDGAGGLQLFRYIMLPFLRPALGVILGVRLVDAMRVFDVVYVLTLGGPGGATEVLSTYVYKETFSRLQFGEGAAASLLLVVMLTAVVAAARRVLSPES